MLLKFILLVDFLEFSLLNLFLFSISILSNSADDKDDDCLEVVPCVPGNKLKITCSLWPLHETWRSWK